MSFLCSVKETPASVRVAASFSHKPNGSVMRTLFLSVGAGLMLVLLAACDGGSWNNPYPQRDSDKNILYSSFSERPKHLDPVRSYSSNEYAFIGQIYEPPLQYHYLKRPYQLITRTAVALPQPRYHDARGRSLPDDADADLIAETLYEIRIRPGIRYQPHPALARDADGRYLYHDLGRGRIDSINTLADLPETGTRELTAEDYVYQIKRLAFPTLQSPIQGVMEEYILGFEAYGQLLEQAYSDRRAETGEKQPFLDLRQYPLSGAEVVDRYTYRIRIKGKYPQFLYWLAMPFFSPMPWEADRFYSQPGLAQRNISLNWYPIGTGPYMLTENNPNLRMVLHRNPYFHGETYPQEGTADDRESGLLEDAGKPIPFIEKAIYTLEKETIPRWNKFLQGYYDTSGIASDSFDQAVQFSAQGEVGLTEAMTKKGIRLQTAVTSSIYFIGFNMRDPVIGGSTERARLLRRAISIAMDFEEFISIFANGRGVVAQSPIPPGIFGHRPGLEGANPYVYERVAGKLRRRGLQQAKALLAEAGYPDGREADSGKPLVLYFDSTATGPDDKARLNWYRKQFAKLGIELVVRATDYNRFQEKMLKGTDQIYAWGWNADYPDPENFLFLFLSRNGKVEHGGENSANYVNAEYDALFDEMKNMENGPERQVLIDRMLEILRRDAPWIWGYHPKAFSLFHSWYSNVKPNLMSDNTLKYKRLDPALRTTLRQRWNPPVLWPVWLLGTLLGVSVLPAFAAYRRHERKMGK